jgi:cobalt-zinc-cadmium efflux system outer membrane protein
VQPAPPAELPSPADNSGARDDRSPPTADEELTLEELEQTALSNNPTLAEAQARIDAARGKWVQVGLPPNTVLGYSGQQLGSSGEAEQQGVFIGQEWVRGGKLHLNRAVVDQEIAIAEQALVAQQFRVLTDVRLGFYEVLVAQRRVELSTQLLQFAEEGIGAAEALLRAKEVSQADVLRARIELQTNEILRQTMQNQLLAAWSRLTAVSGVADMPLRRLAGDLESAATELSAEVALQQLLSESPEVHTALLEVERSRWAVDRARAEAVPNVDVQGIIQHDNATDSSNGNLQVSLPIPWLNRNQGGMREAQAQLMAAELAVGRVELNLQRRLAAVYQRYADGRNRMRDYSKPDGLLKNAEATLEYVRRGYQAGELGYLDLLTAQRTYAQTNLEYVEALGELAAAATEIEGLLLKESLGEEATSP